MSDRTRADLELLRAGLLEAFATSHPVLKAQVAGQLRAVIKDLAALGEETLEVSVADEIAAARKAREADSADRPAAGRRNQPRRRGGGHQAG